MYNNNRYIIMILMNTNKTYEVLIYTPLSTIDDFERKE